MSGDDSDKSSEALVAGSGRTAGRRFGDDETAKILRKAAEMQERSLTVAHDPRALTQEELRQIASEAGIDPRFIDLAVADLDSPVDYKENLLAGGPFSWHFQTTVDGEIDDADRDRILHTIRTVMGHKGEIAEVFGRMEWSRDDGTGAVIVGLSTRDGKTVIDVSAVKAMEASTVHALGIPFGGIFGGAAIAGFLGMSGGPAVLGTVGAMGVASYFATRFGWKLRARWWERRLRRVMERLTSIVQETARLPASMEAGPADE